MERGFDLFHSSRDAGKTFTAPVRVGGGPVIPLNRHRGPRIAISGNAIIITAVAGKTLSTAQHAHGLPSDGDLIVWRSTDRGVTWSKGAVINDVPGAPTEGLHTIAADAHGNLFAAWLDPRGGKGTKLYGARSSDGGVTWSKNIAIYASPDGSICECCHPSAAFDADGQILVMFRNWLGGSRDLYLTRSRDGVNFSKPERLGTGTWQLNACPMDGGGLVVVGGRIVSAWRREHDIYLASPGEKEVDLGSGVDVSIAAGIERRVRDLVHASRDSGHAAGKERADTDFKDRVVSQCGEPAGRACPCRVGGRRQDCRPATAVKAQIPHRCPFRHPPRPRRKTRAPGLPF